MIKPKKKILLFTEFSKQIGRGHYYRSLQIHKKLSKKYKCEIKLNKNSSYINNLLKKNNHDLVIFDFKKYSKNLFKWDNKYIAFDNKIKFHKNLINLNPLTFSNSKNCYCGPNWYPYPEDFHIKNFKKIKKKHFSLLIAQGATDAFNNIKKIVKCLNYLDYKKIRICIIKMPKNLKLNFQNKNNVKIKKLGTVKKISSILKNTDLAITGCGNFSLETSFFGIPGVFVSSEKTEIKRGKILQKKGLGRFYNPNKLKHISIELNKLLNNHNYYKKIMQKKLKLFKKNGINNISKLVDQHINEI